jgi:hypothetical protein
MHPLLRAAADRQWGLFTTSDALRAGYDHAEIRDLCGTDRWIRLRRGVYVTAARLAAIEKAGARHRAECVAVLLDLDRPETAVSMAPLRACGGCRRHVTLTPPSA